SILDGVRQRYPALDDVRTGHELMRRQITMMVEDVIVSTTANLARIKPDSADAVRAAGETMVTFSADMAAFEKELKAFLYKHLYRHSEV
ncbi:MAG: deoxyguanosinetriphosphate triphosphohydrolase, partial [Mesorhizobium sp.]